MAEVCYIWDSTGIYPSTFEYVNEYPRVFVLNSIRPFCDDIAYVYQYTGV